MFVLCRLLTICDKKLDLCWNWNTLNVCKEIKHKVGVSLSYEAILITILIYTKHSLKF